MRPELYIVAFPKVSAETADLISGFRANHDPNFRHIAAHFTLVFAVGHMSETDLGYHVRDRIAGLAEIRFVCRYSMVGADHASPLYYAFLVPDEGFSEISKLRDALHVGPLLTSLRPNIPYVPHITLGSFDRAEYARAHCDELNAGNLHAEGRIDSVTVMRKSGREISVGEAIRFDGAVG